MAADVRSGDLSQELTIFALSSGALPSAIAVVRLSGPRAFDAAEALCETLPPVREARVRVLRDPKGGEVLDRALVLAFAGPDTATGEDVVEFHCHGSRAVAAALEAVLARQPHCRRAEPGEFTRRALRNGRIDLMQAEALGELLQAETESQRRHALRGAEGQLGRTIGRWQAMLIHQAALIEAALAFEDEDEVGSGEPFDREQVNRVLAEIEAMLAAPPGERLRDGVRVVLAGAPNAGKSTLFNALVGRNAAIVSAHAGTTRDRIEAPVQRDGIAYLFVDTAGLREAADMVEAIGVERARQAAAWADIVLWLDDEPPEDRDRTLWLFPRCDERGSAPADGRLAISAVTGAGLPTLWQLLQNRASGLLPSEDSVALNRRQSGLLAEAATALQQIAACAGDLVLVAESLRLALKAFDRLTGRADVEAVLDDVFTSFCLGK